MGGVGARVRGAGVGGGGRGWGGCGRHRGTTRRPALEATYSNDACSTSTN